MQVNELDAVELTNLEDVVLIAGKYHDGMLSVKTCDYFGISPYDKDFVHLLERNHIELDLNRKVLECYSDEEFQELVVLAQKQKNEYAKMRIAKLTEPLINSSYRNPDGEGYDRDEFFIAAIILLYEYIATYKRRKGAYFLFLFRKRLLNLNTMLKDERNPFAHGMGQYLGKIRRFMSYFEEMYGRIPNVEEIASATGISRISIEHCLWVIRANDTVSLNHPIASRKEKFNGDGEFIRIEETVADPSTEKDYVDSHSREFIIEEVRKLPPLEQAVIFNKFGFFGEPLSREKVCDRLGISRTVYDKVMANAIDILYLTLKEYENAV